MRVRIEQEYYGEAIDVGDLEKFVDAVRAATNDYMHPNLQKVQIESTRLVYEREK